MTGLALYKYLFTAELLLAEIIFVFRMERRRYFLPRAAAALAACFLAAFLFPVVEVSYTSWYASIMFLTLFFVTLGGGMFVFRISFKSAFFCAVAAYTAQHLSYEIFKVALAPFDVFVAEAMYGSQIVDFSQFGKMTFIAVLVYFEICLVVYAAAYFLIGKKIRGGDIRLKKTSMLVLSAIILLVDILLNALLTYIDIEHDKVYDIFIGVYNALCCMLVFYILRDVIEVKDIKDELETVSHLLRQAEKQFRIKKEEIDLINIKCHDLKHQIGQYATRGGLDGATVAEIERLVSIYDANVKTGNEVLDIILTEKSLICREKNIKLTCMAECVDLDFMGDGELCALFGNIFDNAIAAVSQISDRENRCISVNIRREGAFISVMEENYYAGELRFGADGLPLTHNADVTSHGFGLRSVKTIAEKYGGSVSIVTDDHIFRLNILLKDHPK